MILDTSFLIDLMKGDSGAEDKLEELEEEGVKASVTFINSFELRKGALQYYDTEEEMERIDRVLSSIGQLYRLPVNWGAGLKTADIIHGEEETDFHDAVIASAALLNNEPVLTRNEEHFENIEGVTVETY